MTMLWLLFVFIVLVLVVVRRYTNNRIIQMSKKIKCDLKSYLFVGHAYKFVGDGKDRMRTLKDVGREAIKQGGLTHFWLGGQLLVVVVDPVDLEVILKTSLEKDDVMRFPRKLTGNGSIFAPVPIWRPRRKVLAPQFSMKNLKNFVEIFSRQSEVMMEQLRSIAGSGPFFAWDYLTRYTMDSVFETALGANVNSQKNPNEPFLKAFEEILQLVAFRSLQPWLHFDNVYRLLPYHHKFEGHKRRICNYIDKIIKLKRQTIKDNKGDLNKKTALGANVNSQKNPNEPFLKAFEEILQLVAFRSLQPWLHFDNVYRLLPYHHKFEGHKRRICNYIDKIIKLKRQTIKDNKGDLNKKTIHGVKTFLELLIEASGGNRGYSDLELQEETLVIVLAGTDTSAVGMSFTMSMLARYPNVQELVFKELEEVFGDTDTPVTAEDLPRLKYLDAVIRETLRLYPPVPVVVRKVDKDLELPSGITLVEGCGVVVHIWGTHRNPQYWGDDAELFRPERFIDSPPKHPAAFLPFSYGPRNCLGYQYAMMSMKTALATILRTYRVTTSDDLRSNGCDIEAKPITVTFELMMKDVDRCTVQLEKRMSKCA